MADERMPSNLTADFVGSPPEGNGDHYTLYAELKREFEDQSTPHHFLLGAHGLTHNEALKALEVAIEQDWEGYETLNYYG